MAKLDKPKVAIITLGCKVNQNESDAIMSSLKKAGYQEVSFEEAADLYVINTCTVTHLADRKSRQMIRRGIKANPSALVVVTGCYAQTAPADILKISGVDLVIGTRDRHRLPELVAQAKKNSSPLNAVESIFEAENFEEITDEELMPHMSRAYLKIQEGCNQYCAYCIIPYARGPLRSRPTQRVMEKAQELINAGYQEIILTGIHTGAYGQDLSPRTNLKELLAKLLMIPGLKRLRISSLEPQEITDDMVDLMAASPVFCPHLHIPLQSGADGVLKRMNRGYKAVFFQKVVEKIRPKIPEIAITTDVMVGFPGETAEEFAATYRLLEELALSGLHVFKYSPRKGTPAAGFPNQVPPKVKEERSRQLIQLGLTLMENYARSYIGRTIEVLVEQATKVDGKKYGEGHSGNYLNIVFPMADNLVGQLVPVSLINYRDGRIWGRLT